MLPAFSENSTILASAVAYRLFIYSAKKGQIAGLSWWGGWCIVPVKVI